MRIIASTCADQACPTVYDPEDQTDDLIVQGYLVTSMPGSKVVPPDEGLVRIPRSLIEGLVGRV